MHIEQLYNQDNSRRLIHRVDCKNIKIPFKCVSQWQCWRSVWGLSLFQLTFYDRTTHFLSRLPAVNELHMVLGARLAAPRASRSASQLTMGQTLLSDFMRSLLQGVLAFDSAKKMSQRRLRAKSCTLTRSCYERGSKGSSSEADFGCRVGE